MKYGWLAFAFLSFTQTAMAANEQVLFEADRIQHNRALGYVDAIGSAQFEWHDYLLLADRARYYGESKRIEAFGNITLAEPSGIFWFAKKITLKDNWQSGTLENLAALFEDNARLTARFATRGQSPSGLGQRNQMRYATYSPCEVCKDEKNYPLWQISAGRITHYERSKTIYYNNAFLEFYGVPVFYVPFFFHPDPSVKRRTGFLFPAVTYLSDLGVVTKLPYTFNFSPQTSLVITPQITTKAGSVLLSEWKHWTRAGIYNITASTAYDYRNKEADWGGHVFSDGAFSLAQDHHLNYALQLASDDDYLDFYDISSQQQLNSNVIYQWNSDVFSLSIENYYIKDYIEDNKIQRPDLFILPHIQLNANPEFLGGRAIVESDFLTLLRRKSQIEKVRNDQESLIRFSSTLGWEDEWNLFSNIFKFYSYGRYDFYQRRNFYKDNASTLSKEQNINRLLGLAMIEWRLPLLFYSETLTSIIEPRIQAIYAPYKKQKPFPDEDSEDFFFDDSNLFEPDRFSGIDRWESGPRANVGLSWTFYNATDFYSVLTFGKVFRLKESRDFESQDFEIRDSQSRDSDINNSGIANKDSDYVASWQLSSGNLTFSNSARFDRKNFSPRRYDAYVKADVGWFSTTTSYAYRQAPPSADVGHETINTQAQIYLGKFWSLAASTRYDLDGKTLLRYKAGLVYDDECFNMNISFSQLNKDDGKDFRVGFALTFTNLGEANFSSSGDSLYDN